MKEEVKLCAVWPMENWIGYSLNQIQGWTTVRKSYSRVLEEGSLVWGGGGALFALAGSAHGPFGAKRTNFSCMREEAKESGAHVCSAPM